MDNGYIDTLELNYKGDKIKITVKRMELSKSKLASEILLLIGFGKKKSIYSDGNFNKYEMQAIYNYIKEDKNGR